jgi:large subunit ribosomal protein L30
MMVYAIVRIRGNVNKKHEIKDTMQMLRLTRTNHCTIVSQDAKVAGMIRKVKDFVTWGEIDDKTLEKLVKERGRKAGDRKLSDAEVKAVIASIKKNKDSNSIEGVKDFKPVFRMSPPRKGFGGSKTAYPKGALGYRGEKINELLERMM